MHGLSEKKRVFRHETCGCDAKKPVFTLNPYVFVLNPYVFVLNPRFFGVRTHVLSSNPQAFAVNPYVFAVKARVRAPLPFEAVAVAPRE